MIEKPYLCHGPCFCDGRCKMTNAEFEAVKKAYNDFMKMQHEASKEIAMRDRGQNRWDEHRWQSTGSSGDMQCMDCGQYALSQCHAKQFYKPCELMNGQLHHELCVRDRGEQR